jgi:hypothetical protein
LKYKFDIENLNKSKELLKNKSLKNNINNLNKDNVSIFIGSTKTIIEALEYGCSVIHIVKEQELQIYSHFLYSNIKTKIINRNICYYSLSSYKKLINLGKKIIHLNPI